MHDYEVHVWVNGRCLHVIITANSTADAHHIAEAQYSGARLVSVIRQIR